MNFRQVSTDDWVAASAAAKQLAERDLLTHETVVREALGAVYKAVALDIDGTLTVEGSPDMDPQAARLIARLLRRGCHVWLITGRGQQGAERAAADLLEKTDLQPDEWLRLRCITHNGGRIHETDPLRPRDLLRIAGPLLGPLKDVAKLSARAVEALAEARIVPNSLSLEPKDESKASGIRIVFNDEESRDAAKAALAGVVEEFAPDVALRTGKYAQVATIDLGHADKSKALDMMAERHQIDPQQVLRVGDQGHVGGNDYTFLDTTCGFTVGTTSASPVGCLPVIGEDGRVLQGAGATARLIDVVSIGAPLRVQVDEKTLPAMLSRIVEFERAAVERSNNETRMIERQLSVRLAQLVAHDPGNGDLSVSVSDLFDRKSGGVRLHDWDLDEDLMERPVAALFGLDKLRRPDVAADGPTRCMYTDTGVLLRGPDYYTNLTDRAGVEHTAQYVDDLRAFIDAAVVAIEDLSKAIPDMVLVKMALAIMDNVRDALLQLLNVALFVAEPPGGLDPGDCRTVEELGELAVQHTTAYLNFLLEPHSPWAQTLASCGTSVSGLAGWLSNKGCLFVARVEERATAETWPANPKDRGAIFRWREADDLIQNLSAVVIGMRKIANRADADRGSDSSPLLAVGLPYGGLELPLLASALGKRFGLEVHPAAMRVSMYGNDAQGATAQEDLDAWSVQAADEDFPLIALTPASSELRDAPPNPNDVLLLDDNCTTGRTVQAARDMLIRRGFDVLGLVIVRFPGANRAVQMGMPMHGFLDVDLAHNFIHGLVGPSPYSRLVLPSPNEKIYEDENGVFDKAKLRVRRLLHKNSPNKYLAHELKPWGANSQ